MPPLSMMTSPPMPPLFTSIAPLFTVTSEVMAFSTTSVPASTRVGPL